MPMLIDITPTSVEFLYNGKIHKITEIMESGDGLMITTKCQKVEEDKTDNLILPDNI
jgi:hypothetical protein